MITIQDQKYLDAAQLLSVNAASAHASRTCESFRRATCFVQRPVLPVADSATDLSNGPFTGHSRSTTSFCRSLSVSPFSPWAVGRG